MLLVVLVLLLLTDSILTYRIPSSSASSLSSISARSRSFDRSTLPRLSPQFRGVLKSSRPLRMHATASAEGDETPVPSFINSELRPFAMKLHTREQAPLEGKKASRSSLSAPLEPTRMGYLQFLVDSLAVYETLETIVNDNVALASLRDTGLERTEELREDINWMTEFDLTLAPVPSCGPHGASYSSLLKDISQQSTPRFICHFYNHYFAHTAGGTMIGKRISEKILDGKVLKFYTWKRDDVRMLLDRTRHKIDIIASKWTDLEKKSCLQETESCFSYSSSLFSYMKGSS